MAALPISAANGDGVAVAPTVGALAECKTLEPGPYLVSLGKLIIDEGYRFHWTQEVRHVVRQT